MCGRIARTMRSRKGRQDSVGNPAMTLAVIAKAVGADPPSKVKRQSQLHTKHGIVAERQSETGELLPSDPDRLAIPTAWGADDATHRVAFSGTAAGAEQYPI